MYIYSLEVHGPDAEICPLYTGAALYLRDRVLGEVERASFLALPGRGEPPWADALKIVCSA